MSLSKEEAQALLGKVVKEWWSDTGRPLLGSQLKLRMLARAPDFHERNYQYKSFSGFVRETPGVIVDVRGTTDFYVAPADHAQTPPTEQPKDVRVRAHFWRAFVTFAKQNEARAYNPETGFVFIGSPESIPVNSVKIEPIPKQEQLNWRREFVETQEEDADFKKVLPELVAEGGFKAFTLALETRPALRRRWHAALVSHVAAAIRAWAKPIGLSDSVWLETEMAQAGGDLVRQQVLALLEGIKTEDLVELQIPIRMLLRMPAKVMKPPQD